MENSSSRLFERALRVTPGGVHSPVRSFRSVDGKPIFFRSAQGAWLESVEGDKYIDFCQSFGPLILGHRDPEVEAVVEKAIHEAWTFGACEPYSLELAEWICSKVPWVKSLRFVCSGTEAVMSALRVARAATGRRKILKFNGCYHGHVDSLLVKSGSGLAGFARSDSAGVNASVAEETLVADLDDAQQLAAIFDAHGSEIAAVIIEPLPANYGLLVQRKEFLQSIADLARKHQALLIFDEVISGFRLALGGMAECLGIVPDLVTYGKVIGGGFPVGAYGGRKDLMDLVAPMGPVYQAGTLAANPIGMQAGLATLKKLERDNVYEILDQRIEKFGWGWGKLLLNTNLPLALTRVGSLFWLHVPPKEEAFVRRIDKIPPEHKSVFNRFFHDCLKQNIYLAPSGFEVGFVSLAHDDDVLGETLKRLEKVCASVALRFS